MRTSELNFINGVEKKLAGGFNRDVEKMDCKFCSSTRTVHYLRSVLKRILETQLRDIIIQ